MMAINVSIKSWCVAIHTPPKKQNSSPIHYLLYDLVEDFIMFFTA